MKISAMSQEFRSVDKTIEDTVAGLAKLGVDGIELEFGSSRFAGWDINRAKKIREACDSNGLAITNLAPQTFFMAYGEYGFGWQTQKELLNVKAACDTARAIDVPYVRVQLIAYTFTWLPKLEGLPNPTLDEQYSQGVSTLLKAVKIAEDSGVALGLDNHFSLKVLDHLRIVKEINSPNLRLFLDTRNAIDNGEDLIATARACGNLLVHSHVKDAIKGVGGKLQEAQYSYLDTGKLSDIVGVPVGMGNIMSWDEYLKTLKEIGYKGFLSIEGAHVSPMYGPYECTKMGMTYLKKVNEKIGL